MLSPSRLTSTQSPTDSGPSPNDPGVKHPRIISIDRESPDARQTRCGSTEKTVSYRVSSAPHAAAIMRSATSTIGHRPFERLSMSAMIWRDLVIRFPLPLVLATSASFLDIKRHEGVTKSLILIDMNEFMVQETPTNRNPF